MIQHLKLAIKQCIPLVNVYVFNYLPLFWFKDTKNFGDALNLYLAKKIAKKPVAWVHPSYWPFKHYLMVGSISQFARRYSIIWGSGIIADEGELPTPAKVVATRGPKSRQRFLNQGIDCPEIYGDPAILLPLFYHPKRTTKKWKLGVIPHYIDKPSRVVSEFEKHDGVHILDIETDNIEEFIDEILQCDAIISSSLHGIIVAETYGIPAGWLTLSDKLMGGGFKFEDYFESTGRYGMEPLKLDIMNINVDEILASLPNKTVVFDRKKLLESCPFLAAE